MALLKNEHADYLETFYEKASEKESDIKFRIGGGEGRTETEKLPNGQLRVSFFLPLDTNSDPTDGRLYLIDRYTYQDANHKNFSFEREVVYNQRGAEKGKWRSLRDFLGDPKNIPQPTPEQQAKFARQVALGFSRPIDSQAHQKIKAFAAEEGKDLEKGERPYYFFPIASGAEKNRLTMRLKDGDKLRDRRSHITRIEKENGYEIVLSYVLNDENPKTKGRLMVQDRFIFLDMDEPVAFKRDIVVANGSPAKEGWENIRNRFYQEDGVTLRPEFMATEAGWKKFFVHMKKDLLRFEPNFQVLAEEQEREFHDEFGGQVPAPASVAGAMERMAENKRYRPVGDYEPDLNDVLAQQRGYFRALTEEVGTEEFPTELDRLPLDIQVQVQGEATLLKLRYRFSDPSFDGVSRGHVDLIETFRFKGKTFEGVERLGEYTVPDPDGRLVSLWTRLQGQLNDGTFPDKENPFTIKFLQQVLPYVAPHVLVKPGEVSRLDPKGPPLLPQEKAALESLQNIETGLVPYLHQSDVDPQFRGKILRAIHATLYQKTQPEMAAEEQGLVESEPNPFQILADLSGQEGDALEPLLAEVHAAERQLQPDEKSLAELREKVAPIQDRKLLADILIALTIGSIDKATAMIPRFSSPQLRRVMEQNLGPLQRRQSQREGFEMMEAVALDLIAQEARDSDKWYGGKPFKQAEAEKSLRSLLEKARQQVEQADAPSPLALLESLKDLNDGEKAERGRLLASPVIGQLNNIAQEQVRDTQGRQYFIFARRTLMEAGLTSSANFVGKWVALHHMPPTRSLEGLNVLEYLGRTQLQLSQEQSKQEKISEQFKIALALQPEILAQLPPEEGEKIKKDFEEKYGAEQAQAARDVNLLSNYQDFFAMSSADQEGFIKRIIESYGPEPLMGQTRLFNTQYLLFKAQQAVMQNPQQSFKDVLLGLRGLEAGENFVRQEILQDPFLTALLEQNKGPSPEARLQGYQTILQQVSQDPRWAPHVAAFVAFVKEKGFPKERSQEGLFLMEFFRVGQISAHLEGLVTRPLLEKIQKDVQAKGAEIDQEMMEAYVIRAQAQEILFSKARDKAVSRPEMNPLEVIGLITDEDLAKDLDEARKNLNPQDKDFEKKKELYQKVYTEAKAQRKFLADMPIQKAFAKVLAEPNALKRQDLYQKVFDENTARVQYFKMLMAQKLGAAEQIPEEDLKPILDQANYSADTKALIEAVTKLEDPNGLQALVGQIQATPDFQHLPFLPVMTALNQQLRMGDLVTVSPGEILEARPELSEEDQVGVRMTMDNRFPSHDLGNFIAQTEGRGDVASKFEAGIPHLFKEVTRPTMLAAMTGAMALGPIAEAALLSRMGGLSGTAFVWGSRGAAAGAVATEGLVLNTGQKILDSAFLTKKGQWENWWGDQKATWLTFGLWRAGQGAVGQFGREFLATGKAGRWAGGPTVLHEVPFSANPLGRLQVAKGGPEGVVYQSTRAGAALEGLAQHGAGIGAIMLSQYASGKLKWQEEGPAKGFAARFFNAAEFYASGLIGAKVAQGLPLGGMQASIALVRYRSEMQRLEKALQTAKPAADLPELVDGKVLTQQLEALRKKAEEISQERAMPTLPAEVPILRLALESLLGQKPVAEMEFKAEDGKVWLKDGRKGGEKGKNDIQVDGKDLVREQWVAVPENIAIKTPMGTFRLGQSVPQEISPAQLAHVQILQLLSKMELSHQESLARAIEAAPNLAALQKSLGGIWSTLMKHGEFNGGEQLAQLVRWIQMGAYPLDVLPVQLGLRGKVTRLLESETASAKQDGLDIEALGWKRENLPAVMDPVQLNYIKTRFVRQLDEALAKTKSLEEIIELLAKVPFSKIEGTAVDLLKTDLHQQAQDIQIFGLGQKVFDLSRNPEAIPGLPHPRTLNRLVRKHLDGRTPDDLASTQNILRYHLDRMTPHARVMLKRSPKVGGLSAVHRQGLIDLYLGTRGSRVMPSEHRAFEILQGLEPGGGAHRLTLSKETTVSGAGRVVLRKGNPIAGGVSLTAAPDTVSAAPSGWHRVRPFIPKLPPLPAAVHMPQIDFSMARVKGSLGRFKKGAKAEPVRAEAEIKPQDEAAAPPTKPSVAPPQAQEPPAQSKGELQMGAIRQLHEAMARIIGRYEEGQEIKIEVPVGTQVFTLKFEVELESHQVRLSRDTVGKLNFARDQLPDSHVKGLIEGLIELKDQPFSLPL